MGVFLDGIIVGPCQSKICEFDVESFSTIDKNVLRLEITMDDSIGVTELQRQEKLIDNLLDLNLSQRIVFQILLEITVTVFKHEIKLLISRNDLLEIDNVGML